MDDSSIVTIEETSWVMAASHDRLTSTFPPVIGRELSETLLAVRHWGKFVRVATAMVALYESDIAEEGSIEPRWRRD